jgi:hypothetical protein
LLREIKNRFTWIYTWKHRSGVKLFSVLQGMGIMDRYKGLPDVKVNKELLLQQLVTMGDLQSFKAELLNDIKHLLDVQKSHPGRKWLKSYEVEKLLGISSNTLLTWRNNGTLPYTPLGGIYYYDPVDIEKVMQAKKQGGMKMKQ